MPTISLTHEVERDTGVVSFDFEVGFTLSRYFRQTWENPAEGGEVENMTLKVNSVTMTTSDGDSVAWKNLTHDQHDQAAYYLDTLFGENQQQNSFAERVYEKCYQVNPCEE